ncbi:hypothetical protein B0H11DRAFT_2210849 [Mycena galericulata]|nr:hypothetical protein B0H11DRAFT_2210849 [Mycena galericulata]
MRVPKTKEAARAREKQKNLAAQTKIDPTDPEYVPSEEEAEAPKPSTSSSTAKKPEEARVPLAARKRRHENSDLYEKTDKRSRTSRWRDEKQITKKARIINSQPSIASLFKVPIVDSPDVQEHVLGPMSSELPAAEHVQMDSDSDIEMISAPADASSPDVPTVPPVEQPSRPLQSPLPDVSSTTAPAPTSDLESDDGYSTGDSEDDRKTHELSLAAIEDIFRKFDAKIKKNRKTHLSPRALTAMTPEKGAQRMVMINGLTEFNIQRRKREVERANLALKIDNAPRSQRPKLPGQSQTKYWAQKLRSTARTFSETGELPENNQGKGAKHKTHFDDPDVKPRLQAFARGLVPEAEGGFKGRIAPDKLRRYVNEHLFPELEIEDTIGVTTATAWVFVSIATRRGFITTATSDQMWFKSEMNLSRMYFHASSEFFRKYACRMFTQQISNAYQYEDEKSDDTGTAPGKNSACNLKEIPPTLKAGDVIYYPIYHDESTIHANDQSHFVWETDDQHELRQKSRGRLIHVSDFIIEHCGRLVLTAEEIAREAAAAAVAAEKERIAREQGKKTRKKPAPKEKQAPKAPPATDRTAEGLEWTPPPPPAPFKRYRCEQYDACCIIHPGAGHDPYWDMPQLIAQTKRAIDIFEAKYPTGCGVWIFDCSSAHEAFAVDALVAHKMNRSPGGKQPKMHATFIPATGERQSMLTRRASHWWGSRREWSKS